MPGLSCAIGAGGLVRAETQSEPMHLTEDKASSTPRTAADLPLMRWVWRDYLRPQRLAMGLAVVFMAIEGSMLGALSYVVKPMFDNVFIGGDKGAVYWVAAAVGGIFLLRAFSAFAHRILMQGAGLKIIAAMQRDMVRHLMTLDSSYFQSNPPGTLIERVRGDTSAASGIWQQVLSAGVRDVISLVALLAVAVSVDWLWTLVAIAGVPLLLGPVLALQRYVRRSVTGARQGAARLSTRLDEIFHGINTLKLNAAERLEETRFGEVLRVYLRQEMRARKGQAGITAMTDIVAAIGFSGVLVYGGWQIIDGDKTVGEFMSFFTAMGFLFEPVRRLAGVSGSWQAARANLERIHDIFREVPRIVTPAAPADRPEHPGDADVVFDDVYVTYGSENVLRGASFTAKAGETTALVGASGAGKSTVFNVLTRLVDPSDGTVSVGGVASTSMDIAALRGMFAVVTQEAPMFDDSIRDNIVLSTLGVTEAKLAEALRAAHLADFVATLPEGLNTPAGPRGSLLSGGQRQRVAIARALLRDAPILLLDEATSALDAESEARVQEALDELSVGRTTLVIAHRLSTVRQADKIVVMDQGRVVDEGRHAELLERGGVYQRLYALQFSED